ncbi:MAG: L-threonylcarbamoyladenylate synthase [Gaiella sp.]
MTAAQVQSVVGAIRGGGVVVIPTDTVYGLACDAGSVNAFERLVELKGRDSGKPVALMAPTVDALLAALPELRGSRVEPVLHELLPGKYTFVVPNVARSYPWLCGGSTETIGVRVPDLAGEARTALDAAGLVAATSANLAGGLSPRTVAEIPEMLRSRVDGILDTGPLEGQASTVVDLTLREPVVLREGAVTSDVALAAATRALTHALD